MQRSHSVSKRSAIFSSCVIASFLGGHGHSAERTGDATIAISTSAEATATSEPTGKLVRISETDEVWIDTTKKRVIVGGRICLRKGVLEMFACPQGSKEHESVVSVNSKAYVVHAALLAVGAKVGRPVQYDPKYVPATGSIIDITVAWRDAKGRTKSISAQKMVRQIKSRQAMKDHWVFAGSGFWVDESTGERFYQAEGGELICLSNFSTATLDLPVESSRDNSELLFEAYTENIPALGTKVRLILKPRIEKKLRQSNADRS